MTITMKKGLALGGLFLLLAGSVSAADAQGSYNGGSTPMQNGSMMNNHGMMMHRHPHMAISTGAKALRPSDC